MPRIPRSIFGDKPRATPARSDVPTPLFDGRMPPEPTPAPLTGPLFDAMRKKPRGNIGGARADQDYASTPDAPVNSVLPTHDGTAPVIGTQINGTLGTYSGVVDTITHQWQKYSGGAWSNISGATALNYTPLDADGVFDIGQTIGIGTSLGGNQIASSRTVTSKTVVDGSNTALNFDGAAVNITTGNIVYSLGWKNGWSSAVAASSGSIGSNISGRFPCMYRGIESPWGNVWQFMDGLNVNDRQAWVCENAASYASNLFTSPYVQLSYVNHNADGYQTARGWDSGHPYASLPTAVGGSATTYYSDYYYQTAGQRIAIVGGDWSSGANAGLSYWNLNLASSNVLVNVGGRLVAKGL